MKHKLFLVLILVGFVMPGLMVSCQGGQNEHVTHYTCPMHPKIKMDSAGECPICGMSLIAVQKKLEHQTLNSSGDDTTEASAFKINPRYVQNIGMLTEKVQRRELVKTIRTYGKVAHDHNLWLAQNEYIEALKLRDRALIKATEQKLMFLGLSEKWIQTIRKTKSADITLHLKTDKVKPKYIEAYVYQEDIGQVKEGLLVKITDQKGRFLENGEVKAIGTLVDLNSRSIRVLVESKSPLNLKLNTFVQVKIKVKLGAKLSVSKEAILFNGDHNMVYLDLGKGEFKPKVIQIGVEAGNYYEVLEGLDDGELVVTNGHFLIDSESKIRFGSSNAGHSHD